MENKYSLILNSNNPSLMSLANIHDNEQLLSNEERLQLYFLLLREPLLQEFFLGDLFEFEKDLKLQNDLSSIYILLNLFDEYDIDNENKHKSVYNDSENIHTFNSESLKIAEKIIKFYSCKYFRPFNHKFLTEIENNFDIFGKSEFRLIDLFASVYKLIKKHPHKNELIKRLHEEMDESDGLCYSGYLGRLVNVIRGFCNIDLETKLNEYERQKVIIFHYLNNSIDFSDYENTHNQIMEKINIFNEENIPIENKIKILYEYTRDEWIVNNEGKIIKK